MSFYRQFVDEVLNSPRLSVPRPVTTSASASTTVRAAAVEKKEKEKEKAASDDAVASAAMKHSVYRRCVLERYGENASTVQLFLPTLRETLRKPQRVLHDTPEFYVALDLLTRTFYMCFRRLLMVDVDLDSAAACISVTTDGMSPLAVAKSQYLAQLQQRSASVPQSCLDVYETHKGFHLFFLHQDHDHHDPAVWQHMLDWGCDFHYVCFAALRGWSVRLNRKVHEPPERAGVALYKHIGRLGDGVPLPHLLQLMVAKHAFLDLFVDEQPCLMR
jgi:hypothetical protein